MKRGTTDEHRLEAREALYEKVSFDLILNSELNSIVWEL